jgi:hypothetical protein
MKKIKLLTAPYQMYNHFMPPVAIGLISEQLLENNIPHDKDDLYVKLHHMQRQGKIDLDLDPEDIRRWDNYIHGKKEPEVEKTVASICSLTDLRGYDILMFSLCFPPQRKSPIIYYPLRSSGS